MFGVCYYPEHWPQAQWEQDAQMMSELGLTYVRIGEFAVLTYIKCRGESSRSADSNKEYFLAGGGLTWVFVAGSITLTNLSTDQLVGMNGNQMLLLALWELSGFMGLMILAKVFLPVYYRNNCTTTTELLERRYNSKHVRALVSAMFLFINIFVFQPAVIYTGALFMISMTGIQLDLVTIAAAFAIFGAAYAVIGGLRAVAVSDTYGGVLVLAMGLLVVVLSLMAIDFDFSGIPAEADPNWRQRLPCTMAHAINGYVIYSDILLEYKPNDYPARHGCTHSQRSTKRCLCRSVYTGGVYSVYGGNTRHSGF